MFNSDYITKQDIKEHNSNFQHIEYNSTYIQHNSIYRILIIRGSGSGKK